MAARRSNRRRSRGRSRRPRIVRARRSSKRFTATRRSNRCASSTRRAIRSAIFHRGCPKALSEHVAAGHAVLSISANDPDLLQGEPADLVSAVLQATAREMRPFREQVSRNATNWAIVAAASAGVGRKNLSGGADERGGLATVGRHRAHVPPRCARSARGVGNAPRKSRGPQRIPEHQAVRGVEVHRARAPTSRSVFLKGTSG